MTCWKFSKLKKNWNLDQQEPGIKNNLEGHKSVNAITVFFIYNHRICNLTLYVLTIKICNFFEEGVF